MTILERIRDQSIKYPDRVAYSLQSVENGLLQSTDLTWQELNQLSDRLATYLDKTLGSKTPVIVYGHKNPYMIVCFLACVKSGRAYCPIDTTAPLARVKSIIDEVDPEIILATESLPLALSNILSLSEVLQVIGAEKDPISPDRWVAAEDVFYIIFTSGSTGIPKGVQITRACLDNFLDWAVTLSHGFDGSTHDTFINVASFSFDLSVMDLYLSLYTGGTLWALAKEVQSDMKKLLLSLCQSDASVLVSTPSFADVCLTDQSFSENCLPKLRSFLFCGETLTNSTAQRLAAAFPKADIVNTYGPTESTVAVTEILVTPEVNSHYQPLPVGREKSGTFILILDEKGNVLPDGEKGEIVIVGDTVSPGYWKQAEKTAAVFAPRAIDGRHYRSYHTGDKGYKKDDYLFYSGRLDLQIKLHGYRIEIEDIENNLMKHPGISKVAVIPIYKNNAVKSLVAYVVPTEPVADAFEDAQKIRTALKSYLPDYMIPKKIVFIEQLQMTNNGKIDRKALGVTGE